MSVDREVDGERDWLRRIYGLGCTIEYLITFVIFKNQEFIYCQQVPVNLVIQQFVYNYNNIIYV